MLSIPDMAIIGVVALMVFGPDQLPKVARRAGQLVRDVQNTSQGFIREMERAADTPDPTPVHETPALAQTGEGATEGLLAELATDDPMYADTYAETMEMEAVAVEPPRPVQTNNVPSYSAAPSYHEIPTPPSYPG